MCNLCRRLKSAEIRFPNFKFYFSHLKKNTTKQISKFINVQKIHFNSAITFLIFGDILNNNF